VSAGGGRRPPRRELVWVFRGVRRVRSGRGSARRGQKGVDFQKFLTEIVGEPNIPKGRYLNWSFVARWCSGDNYEREKGPPERARDTTAQRTCQRRYQGGRREAALRFTCAPHLTTVPLTFLGKIGAFFPRFAPPRRPFCMVLFEAVGRHRTGQRHRGARRRPGACFRCLCRRGVASSFPSSRPRACLSNSACGGFNFCGSCCGRTQGARPGPRHVCQNVC
jgi:hypothetical protein